MSWKALYASLNFIDAFPLVESIANLASGKCLKSLPSSILTATVPSQASDFVHLYPGDAWPCSRLPPGLEASSLAPSSDHNSGPKLLTKYFPVSSLLSSSLGSCGPRRKPKCVTCLGSSKRPEPRGLAPSTVLYIKAGHLEMFSPGPDTAKSSPCFHAPVPGSLRCLPTPVCWGSLFLLALACDACFRNAVSSPDLGEDMGREGPLSPAPPALSVSLVPQILGNATSLQVGEGSPCTWSVMLTAALLPS